MNHENPEIPETPRDPENPEIPETTRDPENPEIPETAKDDETIPDYPEYDITMIINITSITLSGIIVLLIGMIVCCYKSKTHSVSLEIEHKANYDSGYSGYVASEEFIKENIYEEIFETINDPTLLYYGDIEYAEGYTLYSREDIEENINNDNTYIYTIEKIDYNNEVFRSVHEISHKKLYSIGHFKPYTVVHKV